MRGVEQEFTVHEHVTAASFPALSPLLVELCQWLGSGMATKNSGIYAFGLFSPPEPNRVQLTSCRSTSRANNLGFIFITMAVMDGNDLPLDLKTVHVAYFRAD